MRAARNAVDGDPFPYLKHYFQTVAMAQLAKSAEQAKEMYYLKPADVIIMNRLELLYVAKAQALALAEAGYRPRCVRVKSWWQVRRESRQSKVPWSTCWKAGLFPNMII